MLNLMSAVCWLPYKTGCYQNQERGTRNGFTAVIHIRIQVRNPFHKVLTYRPCCLLRRPSWKSECSKLVLRPFSPSCHPPFWILMWITGVNPFLVPRSPFPVPRSPFPVPRSPFPDPDFGNNVQNLPCHKGVFSSVLHSRSSLQNLCFYLRSVLRVLQE